MQNLPKLYKIRNRKKPILDPGAMMHPTGWNWYLAPQCAEEYTEAATQESCKKVAKYKSNVNWKGSWHNDAEAMISYLEQTRWRSSRRRWKLSGFLGRLIMTLTMFSSTLMILPRTCEPEGPLIPRKSARENWKCPVVN